MLALILSIAIMGTGSGISTFASSTILRDKTIPEEKADESTETSTDLNAFVYLI